jgi:hypothetical protein
VNLSWGKSRRSIARSLVAVLTLTTLNLTGAIFYDLSRASAYTQSTPAAGTSYGGNGGSANPANQNCTNGAVVAIGATKSGSNLNSFKFVCKGFNDDATLSAAEATTNVFGTPAESDRCSTGQIGIGIRVIASNGGTLVGGVGLICGNPMSRGNQNIRSIMPDALSAGTVYTFTCGSGQLLAGFALNTGSLVDKITPKCSTFGGFVFAAVGTPSVSSSGPHSATIAFAEVSSNNADTPLTYTVTATSSSGTETATGLNSPITLTTLKSNLTYTFTVSGSNAFGTSVATASTTGSATLPGGETDTALTLNGTSQYAKANDSNDVDFGANFTFQAWIRPTNVTGLRMILNKEDSVEFFINNGKYGFAAQDGLNQWSYTSNDVVAVANEWHFISYTKDSASTDYKFYLDGQLVYTGDANALEANTPYDSPYPLTIGGRSGSASGTTFTASFEGDIDHLAVYSTVRSEAQIKSDMHSYHIGANASLQYYYDFNELSGSTVYNRKVAAPLVTDLTLVASPLFSDVKIVDTSVLPNYTIVKFIRTYLNSAGGWKVPANTPKVSALIIGGGGGGGSRAAGGGGAGGFVYRTVLTLTPGSIETITVGQGGAGGFSYPVFTTRQGLSGQNSSLGSHSIAIGGGAGGGAGDVGNTYRVGLDGGSGGGASGNYSGGNSSASFGQSSQFSTYSYGVGFRGGSGIGGTWWNGGGGGGSAGVGSNSSTSSWVAGNGGIGTLDPVGGTNLCLAAGGGGGTVNGGTPGSAGTCSSGTVTAGNGTQGANIAGNGLANSGSGGGGSGYTDSVTDVGGGAGGSGVIIIRWITAAKPAFTPPSNAYLNVGMTETFTTNVLIDSATVNLTRTFRWESTTAGAGGTYSVIKQGTGAANAFFSWIPTDTSTSGTNYLYRVIVTDSDTAGLFIVDTSTAVYAVINRALVVSGTTGIAKTINVSKSETFTITLGTSTYRTTLTSNNPGISLDTTTATAPVVKISETMTVGTYYETLTVIDSVSATILTPLTIVVAAPPSLVNTGEIISSGLIFDLDFANSASFDRNTRTVRDISGSNKAVTLINSPSFSEGNLGSLTLAGSATPASAQYISASGFSQMSSWTIDAYLKVNGTSAYTCIVSSEKASSSSPVNIALCLASDRRMYAGFHNGSAWTFKRTSNSLADNTWTHVVAQWNGFYSNATDGVRIWFDNVLQGAVEVGTTAQDAPAASNNRILIVHDPVIGTGSTANVSLGYVRIYNRALAADEVAQNFNSTKNRFQTSNIDLATPSQMYGNKSVETFTATSGYGADTISYTTGSKPGLTWSTSGANTTLSLSEMLSATTHYDTITVTDSLGASTFLPIKVTVAKADTLTISMDTATTVVYNGSPITVYPRIYFKGLAGLDTLTASARFTSSTYTDSATVPTDADTYTVIAANPIFSVGALSNYVNVIYETSTAKVTQANQAKLSINLYGAVAGSPFTIQTFGGSGDGPVVESVTAGSTASGCTVSNHVLSNSSSSNQQLTCNILVTKAASKNYKVETMTATVYFMLYINNQPTNQVGSGSTIGLNGANSVWVDPGATPTITGPGAGSYATLSTITITGSGFSLGPITVKFNRNQLGTGISVASDTSLTVTIPSGATSGTFGITNANGTAVSPFSITITAALPTI